MDVGKRPQGGGRQGHLTRPRYFEVIGSEQQAYWLGYMYADASVSKNLSRLSINVQPSDFYHVERFQTEIGSKHKPYDMKSVKSVRGTRRVDITSKQLCVDLVSQGCHPNKMYTLEPPCDLRPDLIRHFIRGFWDGDGSIGMYGQYSQIHMSATGTDAMIKWVAEQFPAKPSIGRSGNEARVRSVSKNALTNLDFMYEDSTISLDRKYESYLKAKERGLWLRHG